MSQHLTMELENEGPAKNVPGDRGSGDLFFANNVPYCFDEIDNAAKELRVKSVFDFSRGLEEVRTEAENAVYGMPETELNEGDPEITDETLAKVDQLYYSSGPWFTPEEGLATANALLAHFEQNPEALEKCRYGAGVVPDFQRFVLALQEAKRRNRRFRLYWSC